MRKAPGELPVEYCGGYLTQFELGNVWLCLQARKKTEIHGELREVNVGCLSLG